MLTAMSVGERLKHPSVWIPLAIAAFVLTLVAGATGAYFALRGSPPADKPSGFIAHGILNANMMGANAYTTAAQQCSPATTTFGTYQVGTPVLITVDDRVVGTGELKGGQYEKLTGPIPGGSCTFEVAIPVSEVVEGLNRYLVKIGTVKMDASLDELRNGFQWGI